MSTATAPAPPLEAGSVLDRRSRDRVRRAVPWAVVLLAGTALMAAMSLLTPPPQRALDPQSPARDGAAALAAVLSAHGVTVDVVRSIDDLAATDVAGTTVFLARPDSLSVDNLARTARLARRAARFVVAAPSPVQVRALGLPATSVASWVDVPVGPGTSCRSGIVHADDLMAGGLRGFRPDGAAWTRCFTTTPDGPAALLVGRPAGAEEVVLLGWSPELQNAHITEHSTGALAIRALGGTPRLVWYQPGPTDLADAEASRTPGLVLPAWFMPLTSVLATGVLLLALVRGRRLGRVVVEPLPVVVPAVETTQARGMLYRRARDHERTSAILRAGTRRRLRSILRLTAADSADTLAAAAGRASGIPAPEIAALLTGPPAADDRSLTALATQLAELERKARTP